MSRYTKFLSAMISLLLILAPISAIDIFAAENSITVSGSNGDITRVAMGTTIKMSASGVAQGKSVSWSVTDLAGTPSNLAAIVPINSVTALLTVSSNSKGKIKVVATARDGSSGFQLLEIDDEKIITVDDTNASIVYVNAGSGESWEENNKDGYYNGTAKCVIPSEDDSYSSITPAAVEFTFMGTAIQWIGETNYSCGKADVYIDGVKEATVDPFIAPSIYNQFVNFSREGLQFGSHTIRIVATGAKNPASSVYPGTRVLLDAFRYFSNEPAKPAVTLAGSSSVLPGETFTVGISLRNLTRSVYAQEIALSYDSDLFEYINTSAAAIGMQIAGEDSSVPGVVRLVGASIGGVTGDNVPIMDVAFKVKAGVSDGSGTIAVTKAELGFQDGAVEQADLTGKTITVNSPAVDKSALVAAITTAQAICTNAVTGSAIGQYPEAARAAFQTAIDAAVAVNADANATQAEVNTEVETLNLAKATFEASVNTVPPVNKSALDTAITTAQAFNASIIVGIENGQCFASDKAAFQAAIDAAIAVNAKANATQAEVDTAVGVLNAAKAAFEAEIISKTTGDLNNNASIDVGDLAIIAYYYDANLATNTAAKVADINKDGVVDIMDLAFIATRIMN